MPDDYAELRSVPLLHTLQCLGISVENFRPRKGGLEHSGPCPVCRPKKNRGNFSAHQDGRFRCFSCDVKGRGSIDLIKAVKACGFQEAVDWARTALVQSQARKPEIRLVQQIDNQSKFDCQPIDNLPAENEAKKFTYEKYYQPSEWLSARGFSPETLERYGVGLYDNPKRQSAYKGKILIRLQRFSDGATTGYLARDARPAEERGADPKYIAPAGLHKSLELWGAWQLKDQAPIRVLYVVESPFACMHFTQLGFPCVALLGWCCSPPQLEILSQLAKGVVLLVDRDKSKEVAPYVHAISKELWVKSPELPAGIDDPEQLTEEQIKSLT